MTLALLQVFPIDFEYFLKNWIGLKLLVSAKSLNLTVLHHTDSISQMEEVNGMSNQDPSVLSQSPCEDLLEDLLSNIGIKSRDRIVHENDVRFGITSTS